MLTNGDIFIGEAGSTGISVGKVKVKTSSKAIVSFDKVHPETFVQIGNQSYIIEKDMERARICLGVNGKIEIRYFKIHTEPK